jgi:hypothetical protein
VIFTLGLFYLSRLLAHPLGNFTINQYAGLNISRERSGGYILDMAEIPLFRKLHSRRQWKRAGGASEFAGVQPSNAPPTDLLLLDKGLPWPELVLRRIPGGSRRPADVAFDLRVPICNRYHRK